MNFLAHLYLSGHHNPLLQIGNFSGDFVKGRELLLYPLEVQRGMRLHRAIDTYTDAHPLVLQSKKRLFPKYRHYSRVLVDLYYDHLLAAHFSNYSVIPLLPYTQQMYRLLQAHRALIPSRGHRLLDHMQQGNWLYHYRTLEGIGQACKGMAHRSSFPSGMEEGALDLEKDYAEYKEEFFLFFEELQHFVTTWLGSESGAKSKKP